MNNGKWGGAKVKTVNVTANRIIIAAEIYRQYRLNLAYLYT